MQCKMMVELDAKEVDMILTLIREVKPSKEQTEIAVKLRAKLMMRQDIQEAAEMGASEEVPL